MPGTLACATLNRVAIAELVVQEFRLRAADTANEAARIVATFPDGIEPAVPLLRSIDDERDVAIVGALHVGERLDELEQHAALDPLVLSWQPVKRYGPRITESAESPPSSYRLAVTESGINDADGDPVAAAPKSAAHEEAATQVGLMWVGAPVGTYGGLMVLLGSYGDQVTGRPEPREWPLPLSRQLHVRIYQTAR
jgi:hypothetical protein